MWHLRANGAKSLFSRFLQPGPPLIRQEPSNDFKKSTLAGKNRGNLLVIKKKSKCIMEVCVCVYV